MLRHALISLILKKGYHAITVDEICEAADVGRSTFYAHFTGKEDLHLSGLETLRRMLVERQNEAIACNGPGARRTFAFSLPMFEHARDHIDLYRAMVGKGGGSGSLDGIRQMIANLMRSELAASGTKTAQDGLPRELIVQHLVGAYMSVLAWWLDGGAKLPPERIDAIFRRLATEGVAITGGANR